MPADPSWSAAASGVPARSRSATPHHELRSSWSDDGSSSSDSRGSERAAERADGTPPETEDEEEHMFEAVTSVQEQLRAVLAANHSRVIDLFRSWDRDGDGRVRRAEMRRALAALGHDAPTA